MGYQYKIEKVDEAEYDAALIASVRDGWEVIDGLGGEDRYAENDYNNGVFLMVLRREEPAEAEPDWEDMYFKLRKCIRRAFNSSRIRADFLAANIGKREQVLEDAGQQIVGYVIQHVAQEGYIHAKWAQEGNGDIMLNADLLIVSDRETFESLPKPGPAA